VGVAGVIAPWSSPIALAIRSLAPALAAGCTAVVKLPTETAQINALFAEVVAQTEGLPPGVVNLVTSDREAAGLLIESPEVPTVSFTGSTRSGRAISATGAAHLKRFGLELGGKTPMIVFENADLDAAIPVMTKAVTVFAGQFRMTGSRLLVQRPIAGEVRRRMSESLSKVKAGPAADPTSDMGPMIDKRNVERVNRMVEQAIAAGARVVVRGGPVTEGPLAAGAFYRPTLLEVDGSRLDIVEQEFFGPVLTMEVFDGEAEAIERANDTEYGLAASIWSRDVDQPLRVARELDSGRIWVNDWAAMHAEHQPHYERALAPRGGAREPGCPRGGRMSIASMSCDSTQPWQTSGISARWSGAARPSKARAFISTAQSALDDLRNTIHFSCSMISVRTTRTITAMASRGIPIAAWRPSPMCCAARSRTATAWAPAIRSMPATCSG
jgi:acyl-CoA reductase-like NAD-dependent aldehyde dehydrogenase